MISFLKTSTFSTTETTVKNWTTLLFMDSIRVMTVLQCKWRKYQVVQISTYVSQNLKNSRNSYKRRHGLVDSKASFSGNLAGPSEAFGDLEVPWHCRWDTDGCIPGSAHCKLENTSHLHATKIHLVRFAVTLKDIKSLQTVLLKFDRSKNKL